MENTAPSERVSWAGFDMMAVPRTDMEAPSKLVKPSRLRVVTERGLKMISALVSVAVVMEIGVRPVMMPLVVLRLIMVAGLPSTLKIPPLIITDPKLVSVVKELLPPWI